MTKTALVTGGARGIGRACALALADAGFDVALVDLLEVEMAATARDIEARGRRALTFQADVSDFARAHAIVEQVGATWKQLDVLLNNAGAANPKPILEITEAEFDRTIAINLKSCFNFIHAAAPVMLEQDAGGRIISISSINALSGGVTSAVSKHAYAAAKAGILGLTRSLAKELGPKVAVNAICPGIIATDLLRNLLDDRKEQLTAGIAMGRVGTPEDVASIVRYLATEAHMFMTGQHFVVDGFQWSC
ncbi:3-oxoacyl-[acyl-carrier-protein] reductase FabG [Bradyrhizobium ivorense]|uniref:3-oxoacyl-[acyl-carrier-protein] reductase FabG n=1 Tax=Bradyrhizobium ivorense TaxID=2511166 RepID=A0A508TZK0_9BRAD|nr:SDR family NAD(P)-dependent oxidoreductase [Bradyrhizobium ivorense]VIO79794.1 3-oxoacyl-[acyl-carrier-protein] reductase FabG [Bradyrhizobium ivorense]